MSKKLYVLYIFYAFADLINCPADIEEAYCLQVNLFLKNEIENNKNSSLVDEILPLLIWKFFESCARGYTCKLGVSRGSSLSIENNL